MKTTDEIFESLMNFEDLGSDYSPLAFKNKLKQKKETKNQNHEDLKGSGEDFLGSEAKSEQKKETEKQIQEETKLKPTDKMLLKLESLGFDMSQLGSVIKVKGNQLIVSSAGSGKTTTIIFKVLYDIKSGEATKLVEVNDNTVRVADRILVSTFLKSGSDELEASLMSWQRKLGMGDVSKSIRFSTLHAEFKRSLNSLGLSTGIIPSSENTTLLKAIVKNYGILNDSGRPLNSDNMRDLESALTYTRNRLDDYRYDRDVYADFNIGPFLVDNILSDWKAARVKKGVMDFEDLQECLYEECYKKNNEEVISFLSDRYSCIYLDEFQDTSQIQYALIKVYATKAKKVVAIGDDDQTIYSWRGSDNNIITAGFSEDFSPEKSELSLNFRCPSNILNAVVPSIEKNKNRFEKTLKSFREGGKVRYGSFLNYKSMVETLNKLVYEDVKLGKSVAILCRVNSDGLTPALILDRQNEFSFSISGDGMTLDSYIGRSVINIVKLFTERATPAVKNALSLLTWDKYMVDNVLRVCKNNKISFWKIPDEDLAYSCPELYDRLVQWKSWRENMGDIQALKLVLNDYKTSVFVKDSQFNTVVKSVITSIVSMIEYCDFDSVEDFLDELESTNERLKARKKNYKGTSVRIATVHEFKGKEADSVYIWNDSENVFPHKNCDLSNEQEIEEERRVHYIASTRAKGISTIMYLKSGRGMFVNEMDLSNAEDISSSIRFVEDRSDSIPLTKSKALSKFEKDCVIEEDATWGNDTQEDISF